MNEDDYHLLCLAEELSELSKEIFKTLRFGMDDLHPRTGVSNREKMAEETHDVRTLLQLCVDRGLLPPWDPTAEAIKAHKVHRYLEVSRNLGKVK
jgi:hypothetical protein